MAYKLPRNLKATSICFTGIAILLTSANAFAEVNTQTAYKRLASAQGFGIGGFGYGGTITDTEKALWTLIRARDSKSLLAITKTNYLGAQLYGLLGLRYLNDPQYKAVANSLTISQTEVGIFRGCVSTSATTGSIAKQIAHGDYDKQLAGDIERNGGPIIFTEMLKKSKMKMPVRN